MNHLNKGSDKIYDYLVKLLIVGDSAVGKTCILLQFVENKFVSTHLTTIGIDFKIKVLQVDDKKIKMQIWDTAGQERFKTITQTYYKGATVNNRESFKNIEGWMKQINEQTSDNVCKLLIGNKCDVDDRVVETSEGQNIAEQYGIPFFETSAKDNINITEAFEAIAKEIKNKIVATDKNNKLGPGYNNLNGTRRGNQLNANRSGQNRGKKKGCC